MRIAAVSIASINDAAKQLRADVTGVYNATGPVKPLTFGALVDECLAPAEASHLQQRGRGIEIVGGQIDGARLASPGMAQPLPRGITPRMTASRLARRERACAAIAALRCW